MRYTVDVKGVPVCCETSDDVLALVNLLRPSITADEAARYPGYWQCVTDGDRYAESADLLRGGQ